jgi:predicted CopG family antitoxin
MSDRLEDFVKKHREEFDLREPDPSVWLKAGPAVATGEPKVRSLRWLRVAAAVAMIFAGSTAGIYFLRGDSTGPDPDQGDLYSELMETEQYYGRMVADRYEELQPFLATNPSAGEMLSDDMEELDEVYRELKEDLKDNASNPEVIEAMILNYRVKLEILEDLLNQLKEKEHQDDENEESISL